MDEGQANPWDAPETPAPPAGGAAAPSVPGPDPRPGDEAGIPAAPDPQPSGASAVDPDPGQDPNRNRVVVVAVVVFVVILVAGYLLSRPDKKNSNADNDPSVTSTTLLGGTTLPSSSAAITGTTDQFNRPNNPTQLGALPNGSTWRVQTGTWGILNDSAYLSLPDTKRRNIAWVGTGYSAGQVQVKISTMEPGAGLVFRYSGPCSYWSVESAPSVASWNIFKVTKCKGVKEGNTGYTAIDDGTSIGVIWTADSVTIVVDGKVAKTIESKDLAGAGKVGMEVQGKDAGKVRFTDFIAGGTKGQGIVKTGAKKKSTGTGSTTKPGTATTQPAGITPTTTK